MSRPLLPDHRSLLLLHTQSFNTCACADLSDEDLLALGLSLKAWPPPLLDTIEADEYDNDLRLDAVWRELGLPGLGVVDAWRADDILSFFRMQQCKVLAFTSGAHGRLGAESCVSWLDEQALLLIADGVLGGWSLFKKWDQERGGAGAGGARASRQRFDSSDVDSSELD